MSLQRNVAASFASQVYVSLVGIVLVPVYLRYMGNEAYGLVGFFAMLQAWFNLLDVGLTPTIARASARERGGALLALDYRRLVRTLECVFLAVALAGCALLLAGAEPVARDWLQAQALPPAEVLLCVQLMAPIIALRWMTGLYRGALAGAERLVWLAGFNAAIASLRFVGVVPLLMFVGTAPSLFFAFQLGVAVIELAVLMAHAYRHLPPLPAGARVTSSWAALRPVLGFSLTVAFTSSVWVLVTQTDKLVLSKILPLDDYGVFTLAVLVASGITLLSAPVGNAVMPRLSRLEAEGRHAQLVHVYRQATQAVAVLAGAAALTLAFGAEALLRAWTGDPDLARRAAPVLTLYALGNGVLAVAAFPYYLQYAKGDLRLHLVGNAVFVVLLVPLVVWATSAHGGVGAGWVWLGMNLLSFVAWLPLVHRRFEPGLNRRWYLHDVGLIFGASALAAGLASVATPPGASRAAQLLQVASIGVAAAVAGALASSAVRGRMRGRMPREA